jgi:hypothetical protein
MFPGRSASAVRVSYRTSCCSSLFAPGHFVRHAILRTARGDSLGALCDDVRAHGAATRSSGASGGDRRCSPLAFTAALVTALCPSCRLTRSARLRKQRPHAAVDGRARRNALATVFLGVFVFGGLPRRALPGSASSTRRRSPPSITRLQTLFAPARPRRRQRHRWLVHRLADPLGPRAKGRFWSISSSGVTH